MKFASAAIGLAKASTGPAIGRPARVRSGGNWFRTAARSPCVSRKYTSPRLSTDGSVSTGATSLKVAGSELRGSSAARTLARTGSGEVIGASRSLISTVQKKSYGKLNSITRPAYSVSFGRLTMRVNRSAAPTLRLTDPPMSPTERSHSTPGGIASPSPTSPDQPWLPLAPWPAMPSDMARVTTLNSSVSRSKCTELPSASTSAVIRGTAWMVTTAVRLTALRQLFRVKVIPAGRSGAGPPSGAAAGADPPSGASGAAEPPWVIEGKCDSRPSPLTILLNRSRLPILASVSGRATSS
ncbi:hypothetical protein [Micromonospora sp. NPDC048830]|uniref:hypothetical protein n=1 Tax=Micromonospora sp. NPDC048830 TaxID=3364257 RepID=UPI00372208C1